MIEGRKIGVVIVAGGSGSRMGAAVPKQFLCLAGTPILVHTVRKFLPLVERVVVVLPASEQERWAQIASEYHLEGTHVVCDGGATRFHSVQRGLEALGDDCDIVAVHDGVRPLVSAEMIVRGVWCAVQHGSAIPIVAAVDSFRVENEGVLQCIDRSRLRAVQTPQVFDGGLLREAYCREADAGFTDDATVVEAAGARLHYYEGERGNLKITTPEDLIIAEAMMGVES